MNPGKAPCLAVFGTGSEVGKSVVTAAICRLFARRGIKVAPFKAQNMSNNSGVTPEGLEMGRAQIVQAEASGIAPHVDMNPILLKPTSDVGSQVVLLGEVDSNKTASEYHIRKNAYLKTATGALDRLRSRYDLIVMEGAGSCAEVNLMEHDIVNFRMAEYADAPVILVADIHKGGVFAQVVGTLACLPPEKQKRIRGIIINRFRGDKSLFEDGIAWIRKKTGKDVLGVLPWFNHIRIDAEDSVVIEKPEEAGAFIEGKPNLGVIRIPHISNFTDFHPFSSLDGLQLVYLEKPRSLDSFSAIILPGSKNTRFDILWLRESGWEKEIRKFAASGGHVLGICGGYQMLGNTVHDPDGLEGDPGSTPGLSLLPVETFLEAPKTTTRTRFSRGEISGTGYEIHMGKTVRSSGTLLFKVTDRNGVPCEDEDGCVSDNGRVMGSYIHGLFDNPGILERWLDGIGLNMADLTPDGFGLEEKDVQYDRLADHLEAHIDTDKLIALAEL